MDRRLKILLLAVLAIGFAVRLAPVRVDYHYWDETVYLQHAEIITGESPNNYNEFDFRPPLFPLILAPIVFLTGSIVFPHIAVALIASLGILVTYWLAEDLFGKKTALAASIVYASSPLAIRLSHEILVDALLPVLWLLTAFMMCRALETEKTGFYAATGVFAALSVLMKFTSLVILPALVAVMLAHRFRGGDIRDIQNYIDFIKDTKGWILAGAFFLVLAPYLAWSHVMYGSALHVFVKAMQLSGATDPFLTYAKGVGSFLLLPLYIGVLLYFKDFRKNLGYVFPLIFVLAMYLPAQFWLGNKELRFLLPAVPFLSIMAARGFSSIEYSWNDIEINSVKIVAVLVLVSLPLMFSMLNDRNPLDEGLVVNEWHPEIEDAAAWLKENTSKDAIVYTNYRYPPLGYYSKREIRYISNSEPLDKSQLEPGYIYYSEKSPFKYPELSRLENDPDFVLNASFGKTVKLFYFTGSK